MITRVSQKSEMERLERAERAKQEAIQAAKREAELEAAIARARLEVATSQQLRVTRLPADAGPADHLRDAVRRLRTFQPWNRSVQATGSSTEAHFQAPAPDRPAASASPAGGLRRQGPVRQPLLLARRGPELRPGA